MGTVRYTVFDGEITSEYRNGVLHDYLVDPLGSTVALVDNTQTITDTFSYSAFGEVLNRTGTTPTPFQYVGSKGYYRDSNTRTYVRARTLNVNLGRWSTQDPIGFRGGDDNLYRYCENNPIVLSDKTGTTVYDCWVHFPNSIVWSHRFISTDKCGTYGFYGNLHNLFWGRGSVNQNDGDDHLIHTQSPPKKGTPPPKKKYPAPKKKHPAPLPPKPIPGKGQPGTDCFPISDDTSYEDSICRCMQSSQKNPPIYNVPFYMCNSWVDSMIDCAGTPRYPNSPPFDE